MNTRAVIDVRHLPHSALDHRSPIWWGNLMLLAIETTMFAILVATYFYLRMNYESWPPPRANEYPILYDSTPDWPLATLNVGVMLASLIPMIMSDAAALNRNHRKLLITMPLTVTIGLAAIALRFFEFQDLHFRWDDNAYASVIWTILGVHLAHLIVGTLENFTMTLWVLLKPLDDKHARDIRIGAVYWYWIVAIWLPLYALVFFGPYFL